MCIRDRGNTDVSYVLTDSPLTVQDRLGSLVTFTSFSDTTTVVRQEVPTVSLGGLDMLMMVHIDPSVRVKVDLDASDNRIELEGGGDLSMKMCIRDSSQRYDGICSCELEGEPSSTEVEECIIRYETACRLHEDGGIHRRSDH